MVGLVETNVRERGNLQIHEEEGAHHQQKTTQVGVEVHNHEQNANPRSRVQPVQPIVLHVLFVFHDCPALRVHPYVLVSLGRVEESAVLCWVLIHRKVVDGVLIGEGTRNGQVVGRNRWVLA